MPSPSKSRRVPARKVSAALVSAKPRRKAGKARRAAKAAPSLDASPLLIAQFAAALGEPGQKQSRRKARSLMAALDARGDADHIIDVMPGARILPAPVAHRVAEAALEPAPCIAVHRRHKIRARLAHASSYGLAVLVSAGIIAVTAVGIVSQAPVSAPLATLALNGGGKAPSL